MKSNENFKDEEFLENEEFDYSESNNGNFRYDDLIKIMTDTYIQVMLHINSF